MVLYMDGNVRDITATVLYMDGIVAYVVERRFHSWDGVLYNRSGGVTWMERCFTQMQRGLW